MQKQFKPIKSEDNLLIRNSKYYRYGIGNSRGFCKLNF